jgi:type 2A phosphatase activator TIP41
MRVSIYFIDYAIPKLILLPFEVYSYRHALCNTLPHLPDMVFHKNNLTLVHESGAKLEFTPMESLKRVKNESDVIKVACSTEWKESRPKALTEEKVKPFDWTFTTDYQGTINDKFVVEPTDARINMFKLMQRENILFYHDLTLFEDELHDHGISVSSAKIVRFTIKNTTNLSTNFLNVLLLQRVMPSGFFVLLRNFVRVDGVVIRINDTRYHFETDNKFILKEYTCREAQVDKLKSVSRLCFRHKCIK